MGKYLFFILFFWTVSITAQKDSASVSPAKQPNGASTQYKNPEFPGGHAAFTQEILKNFRTAVLADLYIKKANAIAIFIVDTDGSMANIQIESYEDVAVKNEFLKALSKIQTKWTPAEENGKKVRVRMRQPLVFVLK